MNNQPVAIGDEKFLSRFGSVEEIPEGTPQVALTVDKDGNIIGDTSQLSADILAQLSTPEAKASIQAQYRASRYAPEKPRAPKYLNQGTTRDLRAHRLPGQSRQEFRAQKIKVARSLTKAAIRMKKGNSNG